MNDPQDWINSQFTVADLHGKIVDYALPGEGGHIWAGEGKLIAVGKGNLMRVRIKHQQGITKDSSHVFTGAFIIRGSESAKLVRNPSGSKNPFSFRAL